MKLKDVTDEIKLINADSELLKDLQTALASLNLYPKTQIDGLYGPKTKKAWEKFKSMHYQSKPEYIGSGSAKILIKATTKSNSFADKIVKICEKRGYELDRREGAVNIFGIEGINTSGEKIADIPNQWNDVVGILEFNSNGIPKISCIYTATTEPGKYYTLNPLNPKGAARLQLGFHKNLWSIGLHRGYEALTQTGGARLVRDKNRNFFRDDVETVEWWRGINLHTTKTTGWRGSVGSYIDKWSAGCVVIKNPNSFLDFMKRIKNSKQYKENKKTSFNFILLWQDWFNI